MPGRGPGSNDSLDRHKQWPPAVQGQGAGRRRCNQSRIRPSGSARMLRPAVAIRPSYLEPDLSFAEGIRFYEQLGS